MGITVGLAMLALAFTWGAHADSVAWNASGSGVFTSEGPPFWASPERVYVSDDTRASVTMTPLQSTDRVFNLPAGPFVVDLVPAGATIDGVEVHVERRGSALVGAPTLGIEIFPLPGISNIEVINTWPAGDTVITLGSPTYQWGMNQAQLIALGAIAYQASTDAGSSGTLEIDGITATIYFTPAPALPAAHPWTLGLTVVTLILGGLFFMRRRADIFI